MSEVMAEDAERRDGSTQSDGYDYVVDRAVGSMVEGPLDGGYGDTFGPAPLTARDEAIAKAKREAVRGLEVPEGCEVGFLHTVPYSGTEPLVTPVRRYPLDPAYAAIGRLNLWST